MFSDASGEGYGGYIAEAGNSKMVEMFGAWDAHETNMSSTWRELEAVHRVLKTNLPTLNGQSVKIHTDNKNVETILKVGSKKTHLQDINMEIQNACEQSNVSFFAQWIPRENNTHADTLSRLNDCDDWGVQTWLFRTLDREWGPHTVDRFASSYNKKCDKFNSKFWCQGTSGVDAFKQHWGKENNWLVPPPSLVTETVKKMLKDRAVGIGLRDKIKEDVKEAGVDEESELFKYAEHMSSYIVNSRSDNTAKSPIFRSKSICKLIYKNKKLSYTTARESIISRLKLVSKDLKLGLHSMRSGGATAAANSNVNDRINEHGESNLSSDKSRTFCITSGSYGEGLEMRGSDLDIMESKQYIKVNADNNPTLIQSITYLSMDTDDVKPGFTQLRLEYSRSQYVLECCEEHNDIHYQSLKLLSFKKTSVAYLLKTLFVDHIQFREDSTLTPDELVMEGWKTLHFFPSTAYAYFLSFLCHHHLNNVRQCQDSLEGLELVIAESYLIPNWNTEDAYTLLGIALELHGDKESARQAFLQSVELSEDESHSFAAWRLLSLN
ncbi:Hypothetical predicted protein [Mytilus galloprovincialis]|uniref:Reverse transcriptase RNase H-like domain-containing protein n=1 Tax=Mytilus galloprovincialis TaxID=29158 RepID=A0A8B6C4N6_MYTGA|nr:Hypothetical predicted protein [Mytilus galloprovincialis]